MVNICLPVVVIRRMKPYATRLSDQHAHQVAEHAGAKMTQKVTKHKLDRSKKETVSEQKTKDRP